MAHGVLSEGDVLVDPLGCRRLYLGDGGRPVKIARRWQAPPRRLRPGFREPRPRAGRACRRSRRAASGPSGVARAPPAGWAPPLTENVSALRR